jgi:nucleoside-diphosphate-sugar epimerase
MKILVLGATGGSGRAVVDELLAAGHEVTAFSRNAARLGARERLGVVNGDATSAEDVERAVAGHDAVVITLGISENPLRVRLLGPAHTPLDVRSAGTRNVIRAMQRLGVRKLVVQSSYGVGDTRARLGFTDRLFFALLLAPQIADTELQERDVKESGLDWVIAQPVHLSDSDDAPAPHVSSAGETGRSMKVSRRSVARFLARATLGSEYVGRSVALSGA